MDGPPGERYVAAQGLIEWLLPQLSVSIVSVSKMPETTIRIRCTFEVLGREKNGANVVIFDQ